MTRVLRRAASTRLPEGTPPPAPLDVTRLRPLHERTAPWSAASAALATVGAAGVIGLQALSRQDLGGVQLPLLSGPGAILLTGAIGAGALQRSLTREARDPRRTERHWGLRATLLGAAQLGFFGLSVWCAWPLTQLGELAQTVNLSADDLNGARSAQVPLALALCARELRLSPQGGEWNDQALRLFAPPEDLARLKAADRRFSPALQGACSPAQTLNNLQQIGLVSPQATLAGKRSTAPSSTAPSGTAPQPTGDPGGVDQGGATR